MGGAPQSQQGHITGHGLNNENDQPKKVDYFPFLYYSNESFVIFPEDILVKLCKPSQITWPVGVVRSHSLWIASPVSI